MSIDVKICGLSTPETLNAAITGGARYVGLVFYPPSPRSINLEQAARLSALVPGHVTSVGLFVDPDDALLEKTLAVAPLGLLQLHGRESPARVTAIKARFGLPVMKVLSIASAQDLTRAKDYEPVADLLMFDAKPPKDDPKALPGGNARVFDWDLLHGQRFDLPWMLAGGLTPDNLGEAVERSGAKIVDVSSGVEDAPGQKSTSKIKAFLATAATL